MKVTYEMTLDEAIKHAEEVAKEKESEAQDLEYSKLDWRHEADQCYECAKEHRQLAAWLKELKQLRKQTGWILCSEEMPEEREWIGTKRFGTTISDEVYVTLENSKGERYTKHLCFQHGKLSPYDQHQVNAFHNGGTPIAWKPSPQPYGVESEE